MKLLVIDDDSAVLGILAEGLSTLGCEVIRARSGEESLALFRDEPPAVVVTDLRMSGLDGLAVLKAVREMSPTTEVIIVTGHADLRTATEAVRQGAFDYLQKPVDLDGLRRRVRQALERHRLVSEKEALLEELRRTNVALRTAQAALAEKERLAALGQVVVGLHHEILNPLTGILGALQVLATHTVPPALRDEAVGEARREIARIERVVKALGSLRELSVTRYVGETTMLDLGTAGTRCDGSKPA